MSALRFSDDHEWVRTEVARVAAVGITHFAQEQLGEIVSVVLPQLGRYVKKDEEAAMIESVNAAAGFKSPLSGTVIEVNGSLASEPRKVNEDPTGEGWLFRLYLDDLEELDMLMDEATYRKRTGTDG